MTAIATSRAPGTYWHPSGVTNTGRPYLSLVIPAYNEQDRLPATISSIVEYLSARSHSYEIIVVDDGSTDHTCDFVREFAVKHPWVQLQSYLDEHGKPLNKGKGYAVRTGVLAAQGRDILFSDADLSTPIEELDKMLAPIASGECDITFASRAMPDSILAIHQPWYREWMGRTFNKCVQRIVHTDIVDTQCGFKAFRGDAARAIFVRAKIDGFGFDTELVFLAHKCGLKIKEIPVTWKHQDDSRVSPLIAPFQMMGELLQIRINEMHGAYDEVNAENTE